MRLWIKLVLGLVAVALMVWLVVRVGGWTLRFVTNSADSGEADPMFADEATPVDRTAGELAEEARAQDEQAE